MMFSQHYGGKRAFVRSTTAGILLRLGGFRNLRRVDWERVRRIVFVCKGNICRSPYAHAKAGQLGIEAASCGLAASGSSPAQPGAITAARRRGIDLSQHRSSRCRELTPDAGDLFVGMEIDHTRAIAAAQPLGEHQLTLLGLWSRPHRPYLHDPYGLSDEAFDRCFDCVDSAITEIARRLNPT